MCSREDIVPVWSEATSFYATSSTFETDMFEVSEPAGQVCTEEQGMGVGGGQPHAVQSKKQQV